MTATELRETDGKGRVTLPRGYANATLLIEVVSDVELRIRKAKVVPLTSSEEEPRFSEEEPLILGGADKDFFLAMLDNPPKANEALKKLMKGE
jgi:hypothetical protein